MTSVRLKFTSRLPVLTIFGTPVTTATQNSSYAGFTVSATGGVGPYAFSVTSGTLPVGITLNSVTGVVSGTPIGTGVSSNIVISVTDFLGTQKNLAAFSLTVAVGGNIVLTDAAGGGPYTYFPVFRNATVTRTPLVAQNAEAIDVQNVVGTPYSPLATTITIGGDIQYFDGFAGGKLVFKPSMRGSIPKNGNLLLTVQASNLAGFSDLAVLYVFVPLDADCVFIDYAAGNDTTGTGAFAAPYKHTPRTGEWTGTGGADNGPQYTGVTAGKCLFYKAGRHQTALLKTTGYFADHNGTSIKQLRYVFNGWGGQAILAGDDVLAGSWTAATSLETYANPQYTHVEKVATPGGVEIYQGLFCGTQAMYLSQYPRPTNLAVSDGAQAAADGTNSYNGTTSVGGFKQLFFTTNPADTTTVRLYRGGVDGTHPTGQGTATLFDPALNARFNNVDVAFNALGVGMFIQLWSSGNNVSVFPVQQFTAATSAVTIATGSTPVTLSGSFTSYSLTGSPYDVQVAGQYSLTADGNTFFAYRPNSNPASVSLRKVAVEFSANSYVSYEYGWSERYSGGYVRATGAYINGGIAFRSFASGATPVPGVQIRGWRVHQMRSDTEDGCCINISGGVGTYGFDNPIFERFYATENIKAAGFVSTGTLQGRTTGTGPGSKPTLAEVIAWPTGKTRWWFYDTESISRTAFYFTRISGMDVYENVIRNISTIHGNIFSLYAEFAPVYTYTDHVAIRLNFGDNVARFFTTSIADVTIQRSNWVDGNVALGQGGNATVAMYSGEPGSFLTRNIFMRSTASADTLQGLSIGRGYGVNISKTIVNGMLWDTTTDTQGVPATWTIDQTGLTGNSLPTTSGARITTNTTTLATTHTWDATTIPAPWQTILGSGQVGPFWRVP